MRTLRAWIANHRVLVAGVVLTAALIATLLVGGRHDAYPTTRIPLESGEAWVASDQIGALTLLDGAAEQTVADVPLAVPAGDPLVAAQAGSDGFALDQHTGDLRRVDGAMLTTDTHVQSLHTAGPDKRIFASTTTLYAVDGDRGLVTVYNTKSLERAETSIPLAAGSTSYAAVVDLRDQLWVLDEKSGQLTWLAGTTRHQHDQPFPTPATLTLANGQPVVVDIASHTAYLINPANGGITRTVELALADPDVQVSGAPTQNALLLTVGTRGIFQMCPFDLGTCDPVIQLPVTGHALGPAVYEYGRVFVPDYTTGNALLVDPTGAQPTRPLTILGHRADYELFSRNGLVFFNDPHSDRAGTISEDGVVQAIAKYVPTQPTTATTRAPISGGTNKPPPSTPKQRQPDNSAVEAPGPPGTLSDGSPPPTTPTPPASATTQQAPVIKILGLTVAPQAPTVGQQVTIQASISGGPPDTWQWTITAQATGTVLTSGTDPAITHARRPHRVR